MNSFNFLGIILDTLTWTPHITRISNKISSANGILSRVKHFLPERALISIYHSLIGSRITYGIATWGSNCSRITKLQKKAVRNITHSHFVAHCEPKMKRLNILKVEDIKKMKELMFYYKMMNNRAPSYLMTLFPAIPSDYHNHNTRYRNLHQIPLVRKDFATKCFRHALPPLLNSLDLSFLVAINAPTELSFKKYIKNTFISIYSTSCNDVNCFSCAMSNQAH